MRHLRRDIVEEGDAEEEPVPVRRGLAAVGEDGGTLLAAAVEIGRDLVAVLAVTSGPISEPESKPSPTLTFGSRSFIASTSGIGRVADGDEDRDRHATLSGEPYPALTAASAAMSMSASGRTIMWFLAPPRACTRFPAFVPFSYT